MTYSALSDVESSFDTESPHLCDVREAAENAVMYDIYVNANEVKKTDPRIIEQSLPNIDKSIGFNPYDTGVLQHKKLQC